ncbi:MAG: type II secretion system F family protein [Solirubrobacterales bacterium]
MTALAPVLAAVSAGALTFVLALLVAVRAPARAVLSESPTGFQSTARWRELIEVAVAEGVLPASKGRRRTAVLAALAGAGFGYSLLGIVGAVLSGALAPIGLRSFLASRQRRYAARVDAHAGELAAALVSAFVAGHSVRGALLGAGRSLPAPLGDELDRVGVDLALGQTLEDALAALRDRTASPRIESIVGAIELHRRCGGDLAELMRELAAAFRARDLARRDAHASTAQARFTAFLVAAMPLVAALLTELAKPGTVAGALTYAPSAVLMFIALGLLTAGGLLCARVGRV